MVFMVNMSVEAPLGSVLIGEAYHINVIPQGTGIGTLPFSQWLNLQVFNGAIPLCLRSFGQCGAPTAHVFVATFVALAVKVPTFKRHLLVCLPFGDFRIRRFVLAEQHKRMAVTHNASSVRDRPWPLERVFS